MYVSMPALSMHVLTHSLNHKCHTCGKAFSRPWLLKGHLRYQNNLCLYTTCVSTVMTTEKHNSNILSKISHWRQTIWMRSLWQMLCRQIKLESSHADSCFLQELQMQEMWQVFCFEIILAQTLWVWMFQRTRSHNAG